MSALHKLNIKIRPAISAIVVLTFLSSAFSSPVENQIDLTKVKAAHSAKVRKANQLIYGWQSEEAKALKEYLPKRGLHDGPNEDFDMQIDTKKVVMRERSAEDMNRDSATQDLVLDYYSHQGNKRYMGIFVESGAANTGQYQWNTQRWAGFAVKELRDKFLDQALANDILNIRMGINIHEVDVTRPESIEGILDFHREAWKRGIAVTDSVLFFSGLKELETLKADKTVDPSKSYQNHPQFLNFAEKRGEFVLAAIFKAQKKFNEDNAAQPPHLRKPVARTAVNPVNEPETFAGFNHFWNNGFANWSDPNLMHLYVQTIINIAKANVRIRMATERAAKGERTLFFHNEAMTPKDYPSHKGDLQFAISKLMLGDAQLMNADFDKLQHEPIAEIRSRFEANKAKGDINVIEASILHFATVPMNDTDAKVDNARKAIIVKLRELRGEHLAYERMTEKRVNGKVVQKGKTAKTDTMVMFDYYQQSEFILPKPVPQMVKDLSANKGRLLKKVLMTKDNTGFLNIVKERTLQAETATGQKLWPEKEDLSTAELEKLLSREDGIVLDKIMGLRNEWDLSKDPAMVARRERAGFVEKKLDLTDEKRIDTFINALLANDALLLKKALEVDTNEKLIETLRAAGLDTTKSDLREIINAGEREAFHKLFGLQRHRRTGFLPPHYARQTRAEMRKGFYETFLTYVNELGIRVGGIGESGTPYYPWAAGVQKQMFLALAAGAKASDFYIVRSDIGPALGTVGWMNGPMTGNIKTNGKRGEDGVFKLVRTGPKKFEYQLSAWPGATPWYTQYKNDFLGGLSREEARIEQAKLSRAQNRAQNRGQVVEVGTNHAAGAGGAKACRSVLN
ncbi:MAG: hypothetical protein V4736_00890 [Bdellovibrionota bacterium]